MTNGKRETRFQHAVTTFPVQFARGAEFRFLRIDVAAGEWAYRPECSRQQAKAELEVVWGGNALALWEAYYIKMNKNKLINRVRAGGHTGLQDLRR